jgi:hypothetical protein
MRSYEYCGRLSIGTKASIKSFRVLNQDADGKGGEVKRDGENAEIVSYHSGSGIKSVGSSKSGRRY